MKTAVQNIAPGKVIDYHGEPCLVLEHRKDGTLLLHLEQMTHAFGSTNNFASQLPAGPPQWPLPAEPHGRQPR